MFAAFLRIVGSGSMPLWTDEGWSHWAANVGTLNDTLQIVAEDRHPPLYFLALSAWIDLTGESRAGMRFLSIAAGLLTIAATYRVTFDTFGRRAAILPAFGLALLPLAAYYDQEIRHYGWLTTFGAFSWLCFLRLLRRPTQIRAIVYALTAAALLYTLYFGVFILAAQGFAALIVSIRRAGVPTKRPYAPLRFTVFAFILCLALYVPWIYVILTRQWNFLTYGISANPGTLMLPRDLLSALILLFGEPFIIGLSVFALGIAALIRRNTPNRIPLLIGGVGLPLALLALGFISPLIAPRILVMLMPIMLVVMSAATFHRLGTMLFIVWSVLNFPLAVGGETLIQPRLPSHFAANVIGNGFQAGDLVVLETGWDDNAAAYEVGRVAPDAEIVRMLAYLPQRPDAPFVPFPPPESIIGDANRVWVIQWLTAPYILSYLERPESGYTLAESVDVLAGDYGESFGAPVIVVRLFTRP